MFQKKFYKNLFQSICYFSTVMVFVIFLLIGFLSSMNNENNFGFILLLISLSLIILFFIIGFYWIFQKVLIDESGIKIFILNKIIREHKWEEIEIVEKASIMRNPALRVKLLNGSEIHLDKRKSIIELIEKYSQLKID